MMDGDVAGVMAGAVACLAWWRTITLMPAVDRLPANGRSAPEERAAARSQRVSTSA